MPVDKADNIQRIVEQLAEKEHPADLRRSTQWLICCRGRASH